MTDEERLRQLDDAWGEAYQHKDTATLERLLADDWLGYTPTGQSITKWQLLETVPLNPAAQLTFDEFSLHLYGDTAVTRGRLTAVSDTETREQRFMRVWAKRQDVWQAVAVQVVAVQAVSIQVAPVEEA